MKITKLLRDLKLNKYESIAYSIILKKGITDASTISKEGSIPFGKIYESLGSLTIKGLIETQDTRPKKYKIRNPKKAFENFLSEKKEKSEKELQDLKNTVLQIEEEIGNIRIQEPSEKIFWTTAMDDKIEKLIRNSFAEAKNEICMLPYIINKKSHLKSTLLNLPHFIKEIAKSSSRGVEIKAILSEDFAQSQIKNFLKLGIFKKITEHVEIRIQKELLPEPFTIIDSKKVILRVSDPMNQEKILAMIKITDQALAKKLKEKFNEMWESATPIKTTNPKLSRGKPTTKSRSTERNTQSNL